MNKFKKEDIGKTFKAASGFSYTLVGTYKKDKYRFYVGYSTEIGKYMVWWNNGNCAYYKKEDSSTNNTIRKLNYMKEI